MGDITVTLTLHELDDIAHALDYTAEDLAYRCDQGNDYDDAEADDLRKEIACLDGLAYRLDRLAHPTKKEN